MMSSAGLIWFDFMTWELETLVKNTSLILQNGTNACVWCLLMRLVLIHLLEYIQISIWYICL